MRKFFRVVLLLIASVVILIASIVLGVLIRNARLNKFDKNSKIPSFNGLTLGSDRSDNPGGLDINPKSETLSCLELSYDTARDNKYVSKWVNLDSLGFEGLGIQNLNYHYYRNKLYRIEIKLNEPVPKFPYVYFSSRQKEIFEGIKEVKDYIIGENAGNHVNNSEKTEWMARKNKSGEIEWIRGEPIDYKTAKKALNKLLGVSEYEDNWMTINENVQLIKFTELYFLGSYGIEDKAPAEFINSSSYYIIEYKRYKIPFNNKWKYFNDLPRFVAVPVYFEP